MVFVIDIIIPAYNAHKTIEQAISSITIQSISDKINVLIINDCSSNDYSEVINLFKNFINIKEITLKKNSGPGVARQVGINNSNSEFIVFLDSDDCFIDCFSLEKLYKKISNENLDVVVGNFVEETNSGFFNHERSQVWLHGKIYRRDYLIKNDIIFNHSRFNEDVGFNQLLFLSNPNYEYLNENVYLWRNNHLSITRINNNNFVIGGILGYIYNTTWSLSIAHSRKYTPDLISNLSFCALVYIYYIYLENEDENYRIKLLEKLKKIKKIYLMYPCDNVKKRDLMLVQFGIAINSCNANILNPEINFDTFFNKIDEVGD